VKNYKKKHSNSLNKVLNTSIESISNISIFPSTTFPFYNSYISLNNIIEKYKINAKVKNTIDSLQW